MKKFREISEAIKDKYDIGEYDQEGDMAKSDLRSIIANSKRVHDMLKDDDNLPEWVQSKITKAEDYMSTVANYMEAEMNEEVGASKKQETTFHKKLDTLVHKTFGKRKEEMKEAKETGFEKTFRKNTGETYDQYANRRAKEEDERQEQMRKQKEDYIKQGIIKAESYELSEGRPSQRHPLEGHEYHRKSDAELVGIAKDAHKAAEAMKSHNTTAENKYRDQANDSATVRYFRKKSGMPDWYKKKYGHMKEEVEQIEEAQVHKVVKQKDGTHDVHVKTEYGEIKHIGTIHAPDKEGVRVAKHKDGTKVAMSKNVDELAKRLSGYHGKTMHEEVEIDEARYPGFRPGLGLGKSGAPSQRDNYKDFNDGRPLGFTPIKDKDEPKSGMSDKLRQAKIKNPAMKSMAKEEVELQELSKELLARYKEKAEKSKNKELGYLRQSKEREKILAHANKYRNRRIGLSRVEDRLKKEEVEQLDEDTAEFHKEMMAHHKKHESDYRTIRHYNDQNSIRGGTKHGYADTTGDVVDNERAHAEARDAHEAAYEAHKNNHKNKHELSKKANELTQALHKKHEHENVALIRTPKLKKDDSINPHKVGSVEYRKHEQQRRQNNEKHMQDHINAMKEMGKSSPTKQMTRNIHHGLKLSLARQHTPVKENVMGFNNKPPSAEEQQKHKETIANELNKKRRIGTKPIKPEQITHHSVSSTVTGVQAHTYKVQHHNNPAIKMPSHTLHTITPGGNVQSGEVRLRGMAKEEVEQLDEKNAPTNPELWSRAKSLARSKFDVYPSAYANGWAAKWYKSKGGGWKSVSEETELDEGYFKNQEIERQETERLAKKDDLPFTPDKPKKKSVVVGKKPEGYSIARQLARQAMQKYMKKPVKEENMSKKAKIVKDIMKKPSGDEKFNAEPEISKSIVRNN